MSQVGRGAVSPVSRDAPSNIYTVLAVIAALVLLCGVGYVWYRSAALFGTGNPFSIVQSTAGALTTPMRLL